MIVASSQNKVVCGEILAPGQKRTIGSDLQLTQREVDVLRGQFVFGLELKSCTKFLQSIFHLSFLVGIQTLFVEKLGCLWKKRRQAGAIRLVRADQFDNSGRVAGG